MPTCSIEETEAVRRYYAAFPALKKGRESPLPYYLPPPQWCRKSAPENKVKMQCELSLSKDWNIKNKKISSGKERRNSYQGQRKNNKKRCNSYSRSFESKENLPEWVTHEGVWDMETQDPVKEFIRAIALDEGYGTCENTVTDEIKELTGGKIAMKENKVPEWDDGLDIDTDWVITDDLRPRVRTPMEEELYAKFEAKFDRSIEALWSKDQNTPDDEYQELPIDFHDLLSSPSDRMFADEKRGPVALTESIWAAEPGAADALHDRLRPLHLADRPDRPEPRDQAFALFEGDDIYDALAAVADTMRSFAAINHSRDRSGFAEVPPRRAPRPAPPPRRASPPRARDDPLTSARTHFRPIRREPEAEAPRHADGDSFDIRGDPDAVDFRRSESGGLFLGSERYLEYRAARGIDYGRLNLTAAQRCPDLEEPGLRLRFPLRQRDAAAQTSPAPACEECGRAAKKMRGGAGAACGACRDDAAEWDALLADIARARPAGGAGGEGARAGGKRRHSAALRCAGQCSHPHARFLPCCTLAQDRPLTR